MLFTLVICLHEGFSFDFFKPFMLKVLGESLHLFGKYLDYEEKYIVAQSKVVAFSIENEMLKAKVTSLSNEVN